MGTATSTTRNEHARPSSAQVIGLYYTKRKVLNAPSCNTESVPESPDADIVSQNLRFHMLTLKGDHISEDGMHVDYKAIRISHKYAEYVKYCQTLSTINVAKLSDSQRKAFYLNIYNALVIHALIEGLLESDNSTVSRMKFFAAATYDIGGNLYSLNDIENGLLRRNSLSAVPFTAVPFAAHDPRLQYMVGECDPRIHFALNCGAAGCPPIAAYSSDPTELEFQLTLACEGFLSGDAVKVDVDTQSITLSMIFHWYKQDFGEHDARLLHWIRDHASESRKSELNNLLAAPGLPRIIYADYNWSLNTT